MGRARALPGLARAVFASRSGLVPAHGLGRARAPCLNYGPNMALELDGPGRAGPLTVPGSCPGC